MKGEINRDLYCAANEFKTDKRKRRSPGMCMCRRTGLACGTSIICLNRHRKWPTPEQFKEEYGEEYPNDGAVYWITKDYTHWQLNALISIKNDASYFEDINVVCACTPWGKPPADWRPECLN